MSISVGAILGLLGGATLKKAIRNMEDVLEEKRAEAFEAELRFRRALKDAGGDMANREAGQPMVSGLFNRRDV